MRPPRFRLAVAVVALPMLLSAQASAETLSLDHGWRFMPGDDPAFAARELDDSAWRPIEVGKPWEALGYEKLDGFAWYRLRFVLPASIRRDDALRDAIRIALGKINNFDQTYLNGRPIGTNGTVAASGEKLNEDYVKAPAALWNTERTYVLPSNDDRLRWGEENVLAVRVFDEAGMGGIWTAGQSLRATVLADYLGLDARTRSFTIAAGRASKTFLVTNTSTKRRLRGELTLRGTGNLSGAVGLDQRVPLDLSPGATKEVSFDVAATEEASRIEYRVVLAGAGSSVLEEESPYVLTPAPSETPRINGPAITAARPGHPILFAIPATGRPPMWFTADALPSGLRLDPTTGIIKGAVATAGTYPVTLKVQNALGTAARPLDIVVGERLSLTPPMGWNSWNCWGLSVDEGKVLGSARTLVEKGLQAHGWSYVNIDDGWEIKGDAPEPKRDADGHIRVNDKFPDMKRLGDRLHEMGLRFGIYSSPGPLTCGRYTASHGHEEQDARSFARWGVDYLKYDWCSYDGIAKDESREELTKPYEVMRRALDLVDRDIVYSLCQYGMGKVWEWGAQVGGQLWRTTEDITDTWESMRDIGFGQLENAPYARPGHWNDPDMLVVGWVGWGPALHPTRLTPDEQFTHVSLWSLLSAPLLLGCDLERLDPFTLGLLTNDEVLALDQDRLGRQATPEAHDGDIQVWVKELADGTRALGIFNLGRTASRYTVDLPALGLDGPRHLRDLWRQRDLGTVEGKHKVSVAPHGVLLIKVSIAK